VQPKKTGKDISVMVWAGFSLRGGRSELVVMERDPQAPRQGYSAKSYIKVLEQEFPRMYSPEFTFQQDNAPIHTAIATREWLQDSGIQVLDWPPYSPDLNPQEHIWWHLKKNVYRVRPDIEDLTREQAIEALEEALPIAYRRVPWRIFKKCALSM